MRGNSMRLAVGAVLLCGSLFVPMPSVAHEVTDSDRCAAKMFLVMNRLQACVAKTQTQFILSTGNACGLAQNTGKCVAGVTAKIADVQIKYGEACGINNFTTDQLEDLIVDVIAPVIATTRFLVTGVSSCP